MILAATFEFAMLSWFQPGPQPARSIEAVFSPEPMGVARQIYGPLSEMGLWTVRISSPIATQIDSGRIYAAAANLGLISKGHAVIVLRNRRADRWQSRLVKTLSILNGACTLATAAYGSRRADPRLLKIAAACGMGTGLFAWTGPMLEATLPPLDEGEILDGVLALRPGEVTTRIAFASKRPNPKPVTIRIEQ